jgi:hypothetical protein
VTKDLVKPPERPVPRLRSPKGRANVGTGKRSPSDAWPASREARIQAVAALNACHRKASFELVLSVGRLVFRTLFSDDLDAWRRQGFKGASLRKIANHPQLAMGPDELLRLTATYEVCMRLGVLAWHHVSAQHVELVLDLPSEDQERLLDAAERASWSIRKLEGEVACAVREGAGALRNRR